MQLPHVENYSGVNGEIFRIRLANQHSHVLASINLLVNDDGEEREINIKKFEHPLKEELSDILENAKNSINLITIARNYNPDNETPILP